MRQLNEAELFYLSENRSKDTKELAKALMTTVNNVEMALAQLPEKPVEQPSLPGETPAMAALAKVPNRGAITMTKTGSEICDDISKSHGASPKKTPEGVGYFRAK